MHPFSSLPPASEKEQAVQDMFTAIAHWYDLNNTLLSLGLHHSWKRRAVEMSGAAAGDSVLDLCTGTGDLAVLLARQVGSEGRVIGLDLNERMLEFGRRKIEKLGLPNITLLTGNAEALQFCDRTFQAATVAFGIRNVTDIRTALREIYRVLKPGGRAVCLEFSRPVNKPLRKLYDLYSFTLLPRIGRFISHDQTGVYNYLPASIRAFPDQERFKEFFLEAGFSPVTYRNLTGGIVAIHAGVKPSF
ncbi:MAG: bifunctional demethylmenaquinone methyltransferase/2-methoxy-6-polyprenyl-1,4-benzoquinol methylase UbiE [Nitrospirae bacterium]|nr:bifunctional demethylmenaquinone methyltransferase/2-methoxy-6-polyprenyl-1,4-benzoquinol methylase UbiE [Nitrospirota bacterium]